MKIISQAPTRIGLIGGGTDVDPFASQYGGEVISLAISLYHRVTLVPREDRNIFIENLGEVRQLSLDKPFPGYGEDKKFDLVYAILNNFKKHLPTGFNLYDRFEGNHSAGLGSSGAAAVAIIGAFNQWLALNLTKKEIALLAWEMETKELKWISGKQDQLAAVFGGVNLMTFGKNNNFSVKGINLNAQVKLELNRWLVLCFTGGSRHSSEMQKQLKKGMSEKNKIKALLDLKSATAEFHRFLLQKKWLKLGGILNKSWQNKKRSNPAATNNRLDSLYDLARQQGALGGKVMGAGGEGHMFFFCPPEKQKQLISALEAEGVQIINFNLDEVGLQVTKIEHENNFHPVLIREKFTPKKNWAVFLDRDGVINKETHLLYQLKDFEFIPGSIQAIKLLNMADIPVIVYHNASVVARGLCDEDQVQKLHRYMLEKLGEKSAYIDALFYCPHHPTAFNPDYISQCSWRKPDSGMIVRASEMFNLDLNKSYVVGDNGRDILMGKKENVFTILVKTGHAGKDPLYPGHPDETCQDLLAAVKFILKHK
ncbi:MAG: HAD-IIIA family hydrolase [Candidatus Beckwithbacteria bacterium]|nr:HAD-IIIA family hydrolase [Candidatus Beckwithbacteria bacterium]